MSNGSLFQIQLLSNSLRYMAVSDIEETLGSKDIQWAPDENKVYIAATVGITDRMDMTNKEEVTVVLQGLKDLALPPADKVEDYSNGTRFIHRISRNEFSILTAQDELMVDVPNSGLGTTKLKLRNAPTGERVFNMLPITEEHAQSVIFTIAKDIAAKVFQGDEVEAVGELCSYRI